MDLLEESAYQHVTLNERFIVKYEGDIGDTSASQVKAAAKCQKAAFKINKSYF